MECADALGWRARTPLGAAPRVPGTDEENVGGLHAHTLRPFRGVEVLRKNRLGVLQPGHVAQTRNIQQHSATDDATTSHLDGADGGAAGGGY